jgi:NAD(P)-dependent dehydrogenase (short-subunit alcohol dehydrogenase family)
LSNGRLGDDDVQVVAFDVSDSDERQKSFDSILKHFGNVDVLINNAGVLHLGFAHELTEQEIEHQIRINYVANVCLTQMLVRHWIQSKRAGRVIVNSSLCTYLPFPLYSAYCASKMALNVSHTPFVCPLLRASQLIAF